MVFRREGYNLLDCGVIKVTKLDFKYKVEGNHPIFMYVNRRCLTLPEAENVKEGLLAIGYEVEIKEIEVENE